MSSKVSDGEAAGPRSISRSPTCGGLALAVAGLVPDLAVLITTAPLLCDVERAVQLTDVEPYGAVTNYLSLHRDVQDAVWRTLSYMDGVNFARRATAPAHFGVGLRDSVCPPSTAFAAYNRYGGPDPTIRVYPFNGHEGGEAFHTARQLRWPASKIPH